MLLELLAYCLVLASVPQGPPPDPLERGYLGVTMTSDGLELTLRVEKVMPGSPAAAAGLAPGDRIVRVGTLTPQTFSQVTAHVMACRPGAVLEVVAKRGDEERTHRIRLAARTPDVDAAARPNFVIPDD